MTQLKRFALDVVTQIKLARGKPPSELLIWPIGVVETSKGKFVVDDTAIELMQASWDQLGHDQMPIDLAHGMSSFAVSIEGQQAYAWATPEFDKSTGVKLTNIEWLDEGVELVSKKKVRYFSPTFDVQMTDDFDRVNVDIGDGETALRPSNLLTVSLTNLPATYKQEPIAASRVADSQREVQKGKNDEMNEEQLNQFNGLLEQMAAVVSRLNALETTKDEIKNEDVKPNEELSRLENELKVVTKARLDDLVSLGRLTPAQRKFAETLSREQLDGFVNQLPPIQLGTTIVPNKPAQNESIEDLEFKAAQERLRVKLERAGHKITKKEESK